MKVGSVLHEYEYQRELQEYTVRLYHDNIYIYRCIHIVRLYDAGSNVSGFMNHYYCSAPCGSTAASSYGVPNSYCSGQTPTPARPEHLLSILSHTKCPPPCIRTCNIMPEESAK